VRRFGILAAVLVLLGCSEAGAPSLVLFGAYFPAWMLCAGLGILGAILLRAGFVVSGLNEAVPWQLFVCAAAGTMLAVGVWLIAFGR
jgi:YtcA family